MNFREHEQVMQDLITAIAHALAEGNRRLAAAHIEQYARARIQDEKDRLLREAKIPKVGP